MIEGLSVTPPVLGRISIGRVLEKHGKRLPQKDDQFTLTSQVRLGHDWLLHPLDERLREGGQEKLRSIPVQLLFNDPALNCRAEFSAFDRSTGRPVCVGNGVKAKRVTDEGLTQLPCPAPQGCAFAQTLGCKPYGRFNVKVEGQEDELGSFIFRTTGFNSIRTLMARLNYFSAVSGNRLAALSLALRLRAKSTTQSFGLPVYYVDLTTRDGVSLADSIAQAVTLAASREAMGMDQQALDDAARMGFANGLFEDTEEDGLDVVEEFFPDSHSEGHSATEPPVGTGRSDLITKLKRNTGVSSSLH